MPELNAKDFDGSTKETSFDWDNPPADFTANEVKMLKSKSAKAFDLLTRVQVLGTELLKVVDKIQPVVESIKANGYDTQEGLPPFPLPGELAPLNLATLAPGLVAAMALLQFLNTELETPAGKVVPVKLFRQISK